ncbi:GNAT family N-acetyltransferase [Ornithinibacillus sp. L9]|uniref:GNAT family N-acetyltransferase n=1 Tax=Ornithinibacillus caprae TaxID=2678566 RepID=A0A6N8FQJ4_9BACI|nr:GNAT family N-acetyltransferase [Ornithinibacillus caprae]MUK90617.1 GNAT family N-acetyltransferase [Ornithinibacillus caprae]
MKIETHRLIIVPCTEKMVSTITKDRYDIGPHITYHLEELAKDPSLLGWGPWFVIDKKDNKIIGDIGFKGKPNSDHTVEVGYGIIPSAQGKGFATEAVEALFKWAFSFDQVDKVIAKCHVDNIPSIRVLEKLQMVRQKQEGTMLHWELQSLI